MDVVHMKNKKTKPKKKPKIKCCKTCITCANCIPIGEGDHLCDELMELVLEEYVPTDRFYGCGGSFYEKQ